MLYVSWFVFAHIGSFLKSRHKMLKKRIIKKRPVHACSKTPRFPITLSSASSHLFKFR
jgi:hypothetical protein